MKLISEFKENEAFERFLRSTYPEQVCDIVIEWTDEALRYVFKESNASEKFILGRVDSNTGEIEYSDELYDCMDIVSRVINEMEHALDDEGNESRKSIKEELRMLSDAL